MTEVKSPDKKERGGRGKGGGERGKRREGGYEKQEASGGGSGV